MSLVIVKRNCSVCVHSRMDVWHDGCDHSDSDADYECTAELICDKTGNNVGSDNTAIADACPHFKLDDEFSPLSDDANGSDSY